MKRLLKIMIGVLIVQQLVILYGQWRRDVIWDAGPMFTSTPGLFVSDHSLAVFLSFSAAFALMAIVFKIIPKQNLSYDVSLTMHAGMWITMSLTVLTILLGLATVFAAPVVRSAFVVILPLACLWIGDKAAAFDDRAENSETSSDKNISQPL